MTSSERSARERALFEAALELDAIARPEFLRTECGSDEAMLRRVESLLAAAGDGNSILPESPIAAVPAPNRSATPAGSLLERPGMSIGSYTLLEQIGEGGCGIVYLAEQREPVRRRVALKILKPGMDTRSVVARFEAERQALALMDHANIARVLDGGATETGRPYFVMELVRGVRITDYCDERRLPARDRLQLFIQVCHAIQHAHQKGVIHRDIKPSNILVTVNDDVAVPKVIDFGIAKATGQPLTDKTLVTRFHGFIGTPAYMSPEQAEFSSVDIDTRSDVYSLGVLMYELLVGCTPFDGDEMFKKGIEGARRTLRDTPATAPSVRFETLNEAERTRTAERRRSDAPRLKSELKGDLDWIVLKCLEKDRVRRYESVGALAQDLQRSLHHEPVEARPPTWSYRARKAIERNRVLFITGTLLSVTLIVAAVFSATMALRERSARAAAESASRRAESEAATARRAAYAADILSAKAALDEANPGRARALLRPYFPKPGDEDLRGIEWRWLSWEARDEAVHVLHHPGPVQRLAATRDGRRFASAGTDGVLRIWDAETRDKVMELKAPTGALEFSPDGALLATTTREGTVLRRTDSWDVAQVIPGLRAPICFAADGRHLHGMEGRRWVRWDLEGRERVVPADPLPGAEIIHAVALPEDRVAVAAYAGEGQVAVISGTSGDVLHRLGGMDSVLSLTASPDGHWVAAGNWHGSVAVWDTQTGQQVAFREAKRRGAEALAFSPDGGLLLSGGRDQLIRIMKFDPGAAEPLEEIRILHGHAHDISRLRFLKDGTRLASSSNDGTVRIWDVARHPEAWGPGIRGLGSTVFDFNSDATEFHALEPKGEVVHWAGSPPRIASKQQLPLVPWALPMAVGDGTVFIGDKSGAVIHWDLQRMTNLWELRRGSAPLVPMAYSVRSGVLVVAEYGGSGRLHLLRPPSKDPVRSLDDFRGEFNPFTRSVAASVDGKWIAYPGPDYTVRVISLGSEKAEVTLKGLPWKVSALAIAPDSRHVAAGSLDGSLMVWDLTTGKTALGPFPAHGARLTLVAYSSDGRTLLTAAAAGGLRLWNAVNGRSMISIPEAESTAAPPLAEGDRAIVFWNLKTGNVERHPAPPLDTFADAPPKAAQR